MLRPFLPLTPPPPSPAPLTVSFPWSPPQFNFIVGGGKPQCVSTCLQKFKKQPTLYVFFLVVLCVSFLCLTRASVFSPTGPRAFISLVDHWGFTSIKSGHMTACDRPTPWEDRRRECVTECVSLSECFYVCDFFCARSQVGLWLALHLSVTSCDNTFPFLSLSVSVCLCVCLDVCLDVSLCLWVFDQLCQRRAGNSLSESENTNPLTTSPLTDHVRLDPKCFVWVWMSKYAPPPPPPP